MAPKCLSLGVLVVTDGTYVLLLTTLEVWICKRVLGRLLLVCRAPFILEPFVSNSQLSSFSVEL